MAPGTACGSGVATTGTACGTGAAQRERPRRGGTCRSWGAKAGPAGRTGRHLYGPPVRAGDSARLRSGGAVGRCSGRRRTSRPCGGTSRPCGGPGVIGAVRADARTSDGDET